MIAPGYRLTLPLLAALGIAVAQVGYPPMGNPTGYPGRYPGQSPVPGGRVPGVSLPKRGKDAKESKKSEPTQPLTIFRGSLTRMDEKDITVEMGDHRVLDFKRTSKTKLLEKGAEAQESRFQQGDEVTVEASQDQSAILTAVNVHWEGKAKPASEVKDRREGVVDTWEETPKASSAERTPAPARPD